MAVTGTVRADESRLAMLWPQKELEKVDDLAAKIDTVAVDEGLGYVFWILVCCRDDECKIEE